MNIRSQQNMKLIATRSAAHLPTQHCRILTLVTYLWGPVFTLRSKSCQYNQRFLWISAISSGKARLRDGRYRVRVPADQEMYVVNNLQTGSRARVNGYQVKRLDVKFATSNYLVQRLRMRGSVPPFPLYVLVACIGTSLLSIWT
jgi:hypothetical protein